MKEGEWTCVVRNRTIHGNAIREWLVCEPRRREITMGERMDVYFAVKAQVGVNYYYDGKRKHEVE